MLVLRRRAGESILIGGEVEVQVAQISPGKVKLAVIAPRHITVLRKEVAVTREKNLSAAQVLPFEAVLALAERLRR